MTTLHEMAEAAREMANEKMSGAGHAPASNVSERRELAAMTDAPDNQTISPMRAHAQDRGTL